MLGEVKVSDCDFKKLRMKTAVIPSPSSGHSNSIDFPPSLSLSLSSMVGLPNYILSPHRADLDKFWLIDQHWYAFMLGSNEERRLWFRPRFSSSVLHVLYVLLDGFSHKRWVTVQLSFTLNIVIKDTFFVTCNDIFEKRVISLSRKKTCHFWYAIFLFLLTKSMRNPNT